MTIKIDRGPEDEEVMLNGKSFPLSRVIGEQRGRFIEIRGKNYIANYWELEKGDNDMENPAYLEIDGNWIEGYTHEQRLKLPQPERQKIFFSSKGGLRFVVSSERITV